MMLGLLLGVPLAVGSALTRPASEQVLATDTLATLRVQVRHGSVPLEGAAVTAGGQRVLTPATGLVVFRLAAGVHTLTTVRIGFQPDTTGVSLAAGADMMVVIALEAQGAELEPIIVAATRGERRVEDTPLRVEVIDEEEISEKVAMTPGDIVMMLNETSGLRVQTTSPSLGGASVRIQGLAGRYSLLLADGLPLYGGQGGGLGLLQIPPVDLGRVEVIKGTASALYGNAALGGVINLLSRRPGEASEQTVLLNQTSRGGTDGVFFGAAPLSTRWGYTALVSAHRQRQNDLDDDGWTDMPGYRRVVVRPRFYFDDHAGRSAFLTAGYTWEDRDGGTIGDRTAPDGQPYPEGLGTSRADVGGLFRWELPDNGPLGGAVVSLRGSGMTQRHRHRFGTVRELDRHLTGFGEAALALPRGRLTYVAGAAFEYDRYRSSDLPEFDYAHSVPALFGQVDADPAAWLSLSTSVRMDGHNVFGTVVSPRVSLLLRAPREGARFAGWSARLSGGTGAFAPTPFTEVTEVTGLAPLERPGGLEAERARSVSLDLGGPVPIGASRLEVNGTLFGSIVDHPLQVRPATGTTPTGAPRMALRNAPGPNRTWGGELLVRLVQPIGDDRALRITGTYTLLRATGCDDDDPDPSGCVRGPLPLTPRHAAGLVASIEQEGRSRIGLEVYYTGSQALDDNPYRRESRPYLVVGFLAERRFGPVRIFVNGENLGNTRQTRIDPLVRPTRGLGGRWTTDAWSLLEGRTVNAGVRVSLNQ